MTDGAPGPSDRVPLSNNQMPPLPPLPHQPASPQLNPQYGQHAAGPALDVRTSTTAPAPSGKAPKRKQRSRKLPLGVTIGALVVVVAAAAILPPVLNQQHLADYREQVTKLDRAIANAESLITDVPEGYEASLVADIETGIDDAEALLDRGEPHAYSFTVWEQADELAEAREGVHALSGDLGEALQAKEDFGDYVTHAEDVLADAQDLLDETSGQVDDDATRTQLADAIDDLEWELGVESDHADADGYEAALASLETVVGDVESASSSVESSNDAWAAAEAEKAKTDPANYAAISDRDWQLLSRDADSHSGEKYVLYGYVTQADIATGSYSIRADTSGEQLGRWYDYNINTIVFAADDELLSSVIAGDTVKLLVEVQGTATYDTAIGGSATAVTVFAYSVEVIG
jgi:hypothetical protein